MAQLTFGTTSMRPFALAPPIWPPFYGAIVGAIPPAPADPVSPLPTPFTFR